ncbi:hypothetical protein BGX29_012117, partial [Mortierella sp. GBA35]
MDDQNEHKDESAGSSTLTESHSPSTKSPSEDLMSLEADTTTTTPQLVANGSDSDTGTRKPDLISTTIGDDGFGDFGTAAPTATSTTTAVENDDDDDGFKDFGTADSQDAFTSTGAAAANGAEDDDDGFGDFGTAASASDPFAGAADDDDDGFGDFGEVQAAGDGDDDEFGDFNDFGDDGFQDSGEFGDFGGGGSADGDENVFGASSEPVQPQVSAPAPPPEPAVPVETAPDFSAVNSRQVENYVLEKLSVLYPYDDFTTTETGTRGLLNSDLDSLDVATVLADQELWTSLCESSFQGGNSSNRSS